MTRPTRDEYASDGDTAIDRCGKSDGYHRGGEGRVIGYSASDDDTIRQADRVPASSGSGEPDKAAPVHLAIRLLDVGCFVIVAFCAIGVVLMFVAQCSMAGAR